MQCLLIILSFFLFSCTAKTDFTTVFNQNIKSSNQTDFSKSDYSAVFDIKSEASIRKFYDEHGSTFIEGIWRCTWEGNSYKLLIVKEEFRYIAYNMENSTYFEIGDYKAVLEPASDEKILTIKWLMYSLSKNDWIWKTYVAVANSENTFIESEIENLKLYKIYPKTSSSNKNNTSNGEWAGNGSGLVISKSGHIITNYHVIQDKDEIEVEFIQNEEIKNYSAQVLQSDKINDLSIIKIHDIDFNGFDDIPYNFKLDISDVGTKIYAYGYPMALSLMGKEIKITDGIISSKTGFDGNVTTYQISAPIQGGNSGGPLFDEKGNLIGINSSGLNKEISDNVGYSIKTSYIKNLTDVLPTNIELPKNKSLQSLELTEQIKLLSDYVVLIKVK